MTTPEQEIKTLIRLIDVCRRPHTNSDTREINLTLISLAKKYEIELLPFDDVKTKK
jgi:hypothetical protein